ncbi:MAG TPA: hypothetical protein VLH38_01975 [Patescibacteria group bacterium]|nr:hypothetical protein [Patescibacteria group bacterium]
MSALNKLELQLDVWLNKDAPIKLPASGRKSLAGAFWWLALIIGVIQLFGAWELWHLGHLVNQLNAYSNYVANSYGYNSATQQLGFFYWLSLAALVADAVLLLIATPKLKQMKKSGWDLIFYSALLNAVYSVLRIFDGVGGGVGDFIGAAIGTVVGAFILFQVREFFMSGKKAQVVPAAKTK